VLPGEVFEHGLSPSLPACTNLCHYVYVVRILISFLPLCLSADKRALSVSRYTGDSLEERLNGRDVGEESGIPDPPTERGVRLTERELKPSSETDLGSGKSSSSSISETSEELM